MIITIMAFDLKTPVTASIHGLVNRVPSFLVYVLSFTVIGIYWNNHHHLLRATERINTAVMWTNLQLLFWLSLIPFATEWVGTAHDRTLPAATYGAIALGAALAYYALFEPSYERTVMMPTLLPPSARTSRGWFRPLFT